MITEHAFRTLENRMRHRMTLSHELDICLAEIRALQAMRCRLEAQLRQLQREARARQEREADQRRQAEQ